MHVLVVFEFSGTVRDAFIKRGHNAVSCDLLPTEADGPHIQGDCVIAIKSRKWDIIIMHPPCTKIAVCGNRTYGRGKAKHHERIESAKWTKAVWELAKSVCDMVVMENPKNIMGSAVGKRTQAVQPYQFGHMEMKETWLWLHGLPRLKPTKNVYGQMMQLPKKERERIFYMPPSEDRGHLRSITYQGIADAMAEQWGNRKYVINATYPLFERLAS